MTIPPRADGPLLTTKQAAAYLGVAPGFLYRHKTTLPPHYVIGARFRYAVRDLDAWLQEQRYRGKFKPTRPAAA